MPHPDPFRDIDRLAAQLLGTSPGSARVPLAMPMDLYRVACPSARTSMPTTSPPPIRTAC